MVEQHSQETSEDTKTLVTVILLIFAFPVGLILMWFWTSWKWWVKVLVSIPVAIATFLVLSFLGLLVIGASQSIEPKTQIEKAECVRQCEEEGVVEDCFSYCSQ